MNETKTIIEVSFKVWQECFHTYTHTTMIFGENELDKLTDFIRTNSEYTIEKIDIFEIK